jgi:hypothetical protein
MFGMRHSYNFVGIVRFCTNRVDIGTRTDVTPSDMMEDSDYQLGKPRMKLPVKERSTQKDVNKCLQAEEMRKTVGQKLLANFCNVVALQESLVKYSGSNSKLLRIRGYVFTFNSKKKKLEGLQVATRKEGHLAHSSSSPEMLHTTEDFLVGKGVERKGNKRKETSMGLEPRVGGGWWGFEGG